MTTVDAFMSARAIPRAHFVSIDTEGEDALVIMGMERMLRERRIDVFEFEFNRKWKATFRDPRPLSPVGDERTTTVTPSGTGGSAARSTVISGQRSSRASTGSARSPVTASPCRTRGR